MNNLLEYKGYHAKIELDNEDKIFVGSVLGINDSLNFHGKTIDELQEQFEICIDDYIEMCEYFGKVPEKEYKGSFNIRIPSDMHRKLDMMAISQETKINQLIIKAIDCFLKEKPKKEYVYVMPIPVTKTQQLIKDDFISVCQYTNDSMCEVIEKNAFMEVGKVQ